MVGIEDLIRPHERDEVLGIAEVRDTVCPAGNHMNGFYLFAADLKTDLLIRVDIALLDPRATGYNDEELPL